MTTMYLPNVYEPWERNTGVAARPVQPTLAEAMALLDAEIEKVGKPALEWREEFGGAYAQQGQLAYEVTPVQVDAAGAGDLAMVCDAYGLPYSAVALARHLVNNAEETIANWKIVAEIRQERMAAVRKTVPEDCWVTRSTEATCLDLVGGHVGNDDGAEFIIEMGCLPCRVRAALGEVPPLPTDLDKDEIIAEALEQAAEEMPTGSGYTTDYWDGVKVQYRLYEDSPQDKTPQAWLRARAAEMRARAGVG